MALANNISIYYLTLNKEVNIDSLELATINKMVTCFVAYRWGLD